MTLPQFPNTFYGSALLAGGEPARVGMIVTAVIDRGLPSERHYPLPVTRAGMFGSGNGLKLKVGGNSAIDLHGDIPNLAQIEFFITDESLETGTNMTAAGHATFYADSNPHVTRVALVQE